MGRIVVELISMCESIVVLNDKSRIKSVLHIMGKMILVLNIIGKMIVELIYMCKDKSKINVMLNI